MLEPFPPGHISAESHAMRATINICRLIKLPEQAGFTFGILLLFEYRTLECDNGNDWKFIVDGGIWH